MVLYEFGIIRLYIYVCLKQIIRLPELVVRFFLDGVKETIESLLLN